MKFSQSCQSFRLVVLIGSGCILMQFGVELNAQEVTYGDISPILATRCVMCHSGPAAPLGLHLDTLDGVIAGSQNGPVVESGDSSASELVARLKGLSLPQMPMTGPPFLSEEEIERFEQWIASGLKTGADGENAVAVEVTGVASSPDLSGPVTYQQVAVIFATRCAKCHTENGLMGPAPEGYRLTSYAATIWANERVRVVPGNPSASELVRRIRGQARPRMPFDGPPYLSETEIEAIEKWVAEGARDSTGQEAPMPTGKRLRLHGIVDEQWYLDDLPLIVTPSTRMDKNPGPGDYVRVRGRVREDGAVVADRIRRR